MKRYVTVGVRVKSDIRSPEFKIVSIGFPKSSLIGQTGLANSLVYKLEQVFSSILFITVGGYQMPHPSQTISSSSFRIVLGQVPNLF